jgi:biopolymer transport protein ExbB/TolQ
MLVMGTLNSFLVTELDRVFERFLPEPLKGVGNAGQAASVCINKQWADAALQDWITASWKTRGDKEGERMESAPLREQIAGLFSEISGGELDQDKRIGSELRDLVCGKRERHWQVLVYVTTQSLSGQDIVAKLSNEASLATFKRAPLGPEKRKFMERICDELLSGVAKERRWIQRINGPIQAAITYFALWLAVALVCRFLLICRVRKRNPNVGKEFVLLREDVDRMIASGISAEGQSDQVRQRIRLLEERTEEQVYDPFHFVLGLLPSLGFIGTIWGMGDALMHADALFSAPDPQQAVARVTQDLGYAFDTTLVGLFWSILVGIALYFVRTREHRLLAGIEGELAAARRGASAKPQSHE